MLIEFHMPNWTLLHSWSVWQLPNFITFTPRRKAVNLFQLVGLHANIRLFEPWLGLIEKSISSRPVYLSFPFIIWKHKSQNECVNDLCVCALHWKTKIYCCLKVKGYFFNAKSTVGFVSRLSSFWLFCLPGSLLWLVGWLMNVHSDHILRNLRKPGETGYKIPRGKKAKVIKYRPQNVSHPLQRILPLLSLKWPGTMQSDVSSSRHVIV